MEFFNRAKAVRLRSQHNKYLIAEDDEDSVRQGHDGSSKNARWAVEHVEGKKNVIRLRSCHGKYLAASGDPFLLGWTGKKVIQASPRYRSDAAVEWEPLKDGMYLKLRTNKKGMYLRANGGMPPWRSSVTHDSPKRTATQDWVLWKVDVLDVDHSGEEKEEDKVVVEEGLDNKVAVEEGEIEKRSSISSNPSEEISRYDVDSPGSLGSGHPFNQPHRSSEDARSEAETCSSIDPDLIGESPTSSHPVEVLMAKQILKDVMNLDLESLISSGRLKRVEKAISVLSRSDIITNPDDEDTDLKDRFLSLIADHDSACNDLTEYATFSSKKLQTKREFQKDLAKAQALESVENDCNEKLAVATARKEELLKELAEIEKVIKDAEEIQANNAAAIDQLIVEISDKSEGLKRMEEEDRLWQPRKAEAEKTLKEVEDDWVQMKSLLRED